jgi:hypothetical protein
MTNERVRERERERESIHRGIWGTRFFLIPKFCFQINHTAPVKLIMSAGARRRRRCAGAVREDVREICHPCRALVDERWARILCSLSSAPEFLCSLTKRFSNILEDS